MSIVNQIANISDIQRLTGLDRTTISKRLSAAGITPVSHDKNNGGKLYDLAVAIPVLRSDNPAKDAAKARREMAEAERAELRVQQIRGELVSVDAMKGAAAELVKTLYQRTVRVLPGILAAKVAGRDLLETEIIIRQELAVVYEELRSLPENFLTLEPEELTEESEAEHEA